MADREAAAIRLDDVQSIVVALEEVIDAIVKSASHRTSQGKDIDDWQVHSERVAYGATEALAARSLLDYARAAGEAGDGALFLDEAAVYAAEVAARLTGQITAAADD